MVHRVRVFTKCAPRDCTWGWGWTEGSKRGNGHFVATFSTFSAYRHVDMLVQGDRTRVSVTYDFHNDRKPNVLATYGLRRDDEGAALIRRQQVREHIGVSLFRARMTLRYLLSCDNSSQRPENLMFRTATLATLTAAFALSTSLAVACPYSKIQQTTEAPKPNMSTAADATVGASIATHDGTVKSSAEDDKAPPPRTPAALRPGTTFRA
ncbi:MAG: hypothetical protein QNJ43_10020 [Breoghania sp.]|nr:hypothetical protein [Breoghania sp.]